MSRHPLTDAIARHEKGELAAAEATYRKILDRSPYEHRAIVRMALVLAQQGRCDESRKFFSSALGFPSRDLDIQRDLAEASFYLGDYAMCLNVLEKYLPMRPMDVDAWIRGGLAFQAIQDMERAIRCLQKAVELKKDGVGPLFHMAACLWRQQRVGDAWEYCQRAIKALGERQIADCNVRRCDLMALAGEIQVKRGHCEEGFTFYREATALCPELHAVHTATLMILNYIPSLTSREIYEEHRRWASRYADPLSEGQPSFLNEANPNRRLRIGYVIPELKRHAVLNFSEPMLHHHDRTQFCLYAYTNRNSADDRTAELAGLFDVVRDTQGLDDERLARTIRQDQIDILVDLCGQTKDHRLLTFARRAAPIQLNSVAYPNTTGLTAMDYRITDEIADPRGEPICHTEELIRLPTGFCCYQPPKEDIPIEPLPALTNGYVTFGATHALQKLNSQVLDLYCEVLKAIPSAKLYLFRSTLSPSQQGYFRDAFAERGIAAERVSMEYRLPASGSHLSAYNTMDIHLDSFPWNGHTTTCDALWMGVPTITLRGDRHASRMAASVLHRIGLDDFVAGSPEHFIRIASKWNADREVLSRLRIALRSRMLDSPLCDGRAYTHAMEAEYRRIWGIWCATHI